MPAQAPVAIPHTLMVVAYGTPAPQGSKRLVGRQVKVMVDDNKAALRTWREDVKAAAIRAVAEHDGWERDYPCIIASFLFTIARPRFHYRSGASTSHLLRENAPHLVAVRPDLDKLIRATCDALTTAGAYVDDARVAELYAAKVYAGDQRGMAQPGCSITLTGVRP